MTYADSTLRRVIAIAVLVAVCPSSACDGADSHVECDVGTSGCRCSAELDCADGLICLSGLCVGALTAADAGRRPTSDAAAPDDECARSTDCGTGEVCLDGTCEPMSAAEVDASVDPDAGPGPGPGCETTDDCADGELCVDKLCQAAECWEEEPCDAGYDCVGGACSSSCERTDCGDDATCALVEGAPECSCNAGFLDVAAEGDPTECVLDASCVELACDENASCEADTDGLRSCVCKPGYTGGGKTCTAVDCGPLTNPPDGSVATPDGTTYGNAAMYTCAAGYIMAGSAMRLCEVDGTWSGTAATCAPVDCGALSDPQQGTVAAPNGTTLGKQATYTCATGHTPTGSTTRTCQPSGIWSGTAPTCDPVDCGSLSNPPQGTVSTAAGTTFGKQATYSCVTGHSLSGTATRTCQAGATWSGSAPSCLPVDCGAPPAPKDGKVSTTSGTTYNKTAQYTCNPGFSLTGNMTRTCQANAKWDGSLPTCSCSPNLQTDPNNCGACGVKCDSGLCSVGKCVRRVFLSSTRFAADIGSLSNADAACQNLASAAGLPGKFSAWLSSAGGSPSSRFVKGSGEYRRPDGVKVADNYNDLVDGTLDNPISVHENGVAATYSPSYAYTGTNPDGTRIVIPPSDPNFDYGADCQNWTWDADGRWGARGNWTNTEAGWTYAGGRISCSWDLPIYCVQQ